MQLLFYISYSSDDNVGYTFFETILSMIYFCLCLFLNSVLLGPIVWACI